MLAKTVITNNNLTVTKLKKLKIIYLNLFQPLNPLKRISNW